MPYHMRWRKIYGRGIHDIFSFALYIKELSDLSDRICQKREIFQAFSSLGYHFVESTLSAVSINACGTEQSNVLLSVSNESH